MTAACFYSPTSSTPSKPRRRALINPNKKNGVRRSIRVPASSKEFADIPADDYSWTKYGQKTLKGSPHPRGYYKCSSVKDCLARKHVERCLEDSSMLIITYQGEHNHQSLPAESVNT